MQLSGSASSSNASLGFSPPSPSNTPSAHRHIGTTKTGPTGQRETRAADFGTKHFPQASRSNNRPSADPESAAAHAALRAPRGSIAVPSGVGIMSSATGRRVGVEGDELVGSLRQSGLEGELSLSSAGAPRIHSPVFSCVSRCSAHRSKRGLNACDLELSDGAGRVPSSAIRHRRRAHASPTSTVASCYRSYELRTLLVPAVHVCVRTGAFSSWTDGFELLGPTSVAKEWPVRTDAVGTCLIDRRSLGVRRCGPQ